MSSPTANDIAKANAERLKTEGNVLHSQRNHQAAYQKYSEAIKEDPNNAVLWSNRAAACLAMDRHLDAVGDALQATKLDPTYPKAWARLATARGNINAWRESAIAWKSALQSLPTDRELTDTEKSFKTQFQDGLKKAQDAYESADSKTEATAVPIDELPWSRAFALQEEFQATGALSSSSVIMSAYANWEKGIKTLEGQHRRMFNGQMCVVGQTGGLEGLYYGILFDPRIFHISRNDFLELYNKQVIIETTQWNAWRNEGPKVIQEEALKRVETSGWQNVRNAVAATIQAWTIRAFFQLKVHKSISGLFETAIEMLEWGRTVWKDVPVEQRGPIFDDAFILESGDSSSLGSLDPADTVPEERLQKIQETATAVLDDIGKSKPSTYTFDPSGGVEFGFWAAFWLYPRGEALAALAWRNMRIGHSKELLLQERLDHYAAAAELYKDAVQCFPKDDELHLKYRMAALDALWHSKAPLSVTLPYVREVAPLVPGVRKIWASTQTFRKTLEQIEKARMFEDQAQKSVDNGEATLDDVLYPDSVKEVLSA